MLNGTGANATLCTSMLLKRRLVFACAVPCTSVSPAVAAWLNTVVADHERLQAQRQRSAADRTANLVAHALPRVLLSALLPYPTQHWEFVHDEAGRPRLNAQQDGNDFCISLSHTTGLVACALAVAHKVGVDAEPCMDRGLNVVTGDWLTPEERATLTMLAPAPQAAAALRLWTLKEAFAKALGLGLRLPFGTVGFALDPPRLCSAPPGCAGQWQFAQLHPTPDHILAVAVCRAGGRPVEIAIDVLSLETLRSLLEDRYRRGAEKRSAVDRRDG